MHKNSEVNTDEIQKRHANPIVNIVDRSAVKEHRVTKDEKLK